MTHRRFASNKLENLLDKLKTQLSIVNPFIPKVIVVPSQRIKSWIQQQIADDPDFGVAMGLRFMGLMPAMEYLANRSLFISENSLALDIEGAIFNILASNEKNSKRFYPLVTYVKPENEKFYTERRVRQLADHLARAFLKMTRYGGAFLTSWLENPGWKQALWKRTIKTHVYDQLSVLEPLDQYGEMHFFGLPAIPDVFLRFLEKSQSHITHYILSPCQVFWGDVVSDQMRLAILKKEKNTDLDAYMQDRNPLLANWGSKLNFKQLEEQEVKEIYQEPSAATLLSRVQRDILLSETGSNFSSDDTLQVHAAHSKQREIEVLKSALIHLGVQKKIKPQEILVLAPNIDDYVPFIQSVFGADCPFNFVIDDVNQRRGSVFLQAVEGLIQLVKGRFAPSDVLDFFSNPCVRKRCQIHSEDLRLLEKWAEHCGVHFGLNTEHRDALLKLPGIEDKMLEVTNRGTWEFAFDGLLAGLAVLPQRDTPCDLWPLDFVENAVSESLGKWIRLLKSLRCNFRPMKIEDWKHWFQTYILDFVDTQYDERGVGLFLDALSALQCQGIHAFSFDSVWERLQSAFQSVTSTLHGGDVNAVTFCSMRTGRAHPASLIWCLGMQDGIYPRLSFVNPMDDMGQKGDPHPTHADEDRHLFLELFLSARDAFYVSYLSHSQTDGKLQGPSILVEELLDYVDLNLTVHHPKQAFDARYFSMDFPWPSYDKHLFSIADNKTGKTLPHLIPQFFGKNIDCPKSKSEQSIEIKDLVSFAKNPLAHFLKRRLGIYLKYEEEDKEFHLSTLDRYLLRKNLLLASCPNAIEAHRKSGQFPLGRFGEIADKRLRAYEKKMNEKLEEFAVDSSDIFCIQLDKSDVKRVYITENVVGLHAMTLELSDGNQVSIHGRIENVTSKGLIVQSKSGLTDRVRVWPLMLLSAVTDVCQPQTLFLEDGKTYTLDSPKEALVRYIEYYLKALGDPSPLIAPWASALLQKTPRDLLKAQMTDRAIDPYVTWAINSDEKINAQAIFSRWSNELRRVFDGNL